MKTHIHSAAVAFFLACLLAQSGCQSVPSQTPQDVSQYPTNSAVLPGKGPASKWSGLPKVWAQRQALFAQTADQDQGAVVFLGDSITEQWKSLADNFPGIKTANRGISGDTTRGVLYRLEANVLSLHPRAIVLLIGTNDLSAGADPSDTADNIEAIVEATHRKYPGLPIIVCEVMPSSEKQHRPAAKIEKLNALIVKEMAHQRHVLICDTWSIYADADGDCSRDEFPDLLHPNAVGYSKWTNALNPVFAKLNL